VARSKEMGAVVVGGHDQTRRRFQFSCHQGLARITVPPRSMLRVLGRAKLRGSKLPDSGAVDQSNRCSSRAVDAAATLNLPGLGVVSARPRADFCVVNAGAFLIIAAQCAMGLAHADLDVWSVRPRRPSAILLRMVEALQALRDVSDYSRSTRPHVTKDAPS